MHALAGSPIGTTVRIQGHDQRFDLDYDLDAYLPNPLPDSIDLDHTTWAVISEAMVELGRLDASAQQLPNPGLVSRFVTRVEAVGTSALEGTYAELSEVFAAEAVAEKDRSREVPARVREVLNYAIAADLGHHAVMEQSISRGLLSNLQAVIVRGTDSDGPEAGRLRTSQVFIGPRDRPITEARFVPPPPGDQLSALVEDWVSWVAGERGASIQVIARVAAAHYQFEAVHPFYDGNGRLGRLAAILQLRRAGVVNAPVLAISPWLKERETDYKDGLFNVSATGDWNPWIAFFAEALIASSATARSRIGRLIELQRQLSERVREEVPRGRLAVDIVDDLIRYPILSVADAEHRYSRTNQAARNAVNRLVDVGLLELYNDASYGRLYWNPSIFRNIDRADRDLQG